MQGIITALLDRPDLISPAAFEAPEILEAWDAHYSIRRSATGVASSMAGRPKLPSNLSPNARDLIVARFGRSYGTAILAASQEDPDLLAGYLADATVAVRNALAVNPHLPVDMAPDLEDSLREFASTRVLFRDSWLPFLLTEEGTKIVQHRLRVLTTTPDQERAKAFVAAHPELVDVWLTAERRVLSHWPAIGEVVDRALEVGVGATAVEAILNCDLDFDVIVERIRHHLAATQDPLSLRLGLTRGLSATITRAAQRGLGVSDRKLALLSELVRTAEVAELEKWPIHLYGLIMTLSADPEMAAFAFIKQGSRSSDLSASPIWFETALEVNRFRAREIENRSSVGRWDAPELTSATAHRLLSAPSLSDAERVDKMVMLLDSAAPADALDRLTRLPDVMEQAGVDPCEVVSRLSSDTRWVLADHSEWRPYLGRHVPISEFFDVLKPSKTHDCAWVDRNNAWSALISHRGKADAAALAAGANLRSTATFAHEFWKAVETLVFTHRKEDRGRSSGPPGFELGACIRRMLEAAPTHLWLAMPHLKLQPDTWVDYLDPAARTPLLENILATTGKAVPAPLRALLVHLHRLQMESSSELSLVEKVELTTQRGFEVSSLSLGPELNSELLAALSDHFGTDSSAWSVFASMAETWPADLPSLVWMATDRSLGQPASPDSDPDFSGS